LKPDGKSQIFLDAARQTTIISPKTTTTIGTWNVRTMFESGKTAQLAQEMRIYTKLSGREVVRRYWFQENYSYIQDSKKMILPIIRV
jgi:hypothetical protein